jgi:hypothetical protein
MRRIALFAATLAALFGSSAADAYLGQVVSSFPGPHVNLRGLGRSGNYLHVLAYSVPNYVYNCHPTTGSVYSSWPTPRTYGNMGLDYSEGGHVYVGCITNDHVYDCDRANGSIYRSWNAGHDPRGIAPLCTGDGGAGTTGIFTYDDSPNTCFLHNLTGSRLSSFPLTHRYEFDMAYDHRNRLFWKYYWTSGPGRIYGYSATSGQARLYFYAPPGGTAYGLAYYGQYLWTAHHNGYIYIVHCPFPVTIAPASLGKVKAVFK